MVEDDNADVCEGDGEEKYRISGGLKDLILPIDELEPDPRNARQGHDLESIGKSLTELTQYKPIVVDANTMRIAAGNGTWAAAKKLGWTHIAANVMPLSEEEFIKLSIADNRLTDVSLFNINTLGDLLSDFDNPLDIPGVSEEWLDFVIHGSDSKLSDDDLSEFYTDEEDPKPPKKCPHCGEEI